MSQPGYYTSLLILLGLVSDSSVEGFVNCESTFYLVLCSIAWFCSILKKRTTRQIHPVLKKADFLDKVGGGGGLVSAFDFWILLIILLPCLEI